MQGYFSDALSDVLKQLDHYMKDPKAGEFGITRSDDPPPKKFVARLYVKQPNFSSYDSLLTRYDTRVVIVSSESCDKELAAWEALEKAIKVVYAGMIVRNEIAGIQKRLQQLREEYQKIVEELTNVKNDENTAAPDGAN